VLACEGLLEGCTSSACSCTLRVRLPPGPVVLQTIRPMRRHLLHITVHTNLVRGILREAQEALLPPPPQQQPAGRGRCRKGRKGRCVLRQPEHQLPRNKQPQESVPCGRPCLLDVPRSEGRASAVRPWRSPSVQLPRGSHCSRLHRCAQALARTVVRPISAADAVEHA
jgi:hypothetical protein